MTMQGTSTNAPAERLILDSNVVAEAERKARVLRSQAFTQAFCAPWSGIRSCIDAARRAAGAPLQAGV
jgi:hypothetical protein